MVDPQSSRFWQAAVQSELVDVEGLTACLDAIPAEKRVPDQLDRRLARQAVTSGLITLWQAQQLLSGRSTGFKINRYTLLDLIGQGGMGRVYLAKDTRLNRRVAVKILSPERVNNPRAIARFQREARVGAQLQHENLVRIYDEGEANGKCYIVMEYIEGKNIGTLIAENGPLPYGFAARLTRQVALGLQHAQQKGLIHRDVNPYNILVTQDGTAKLTDLGLAIDLADEAAVTRDGATVGTFDYVSPEQARHSHSVDTRSDIYSLGCTLYHMLAGRVPFPSPSLPEKLFGHQAVEPEPIISLNPNVPEGLAAVVVRMMRKAAEARYADPLELALALEPFVDVLGSASGSHDDMPTGSGSGIVKQPLSAETKVSRHIEPAAPAAPVPAAAPPAAATPLPATISATAPAFDLGIDFGGGGSRSTPAPAATESFNLGIALDAPPAAPKPPAPAPAPVAAKAPKPAAPVAEAPAPQPDFAFNLGGEKPAEAAFNLGISLDAPSSPATRPVPPPSQKPAAPATPKPAVPAPAPAAVTAKPPKPAALVAEAPAPQPDFAFNLGGEKPAEGAFNLGISLDAPPAEAKAAAPPKAAAKAAAPPKPAPAAPVPAPAPAAVPALDEGALPPGFNFNFGEDKKEPASDALNLGLSLDLGTEPASPPSKPAPKKPTPAPAPAPTPAPAAAKAAPAPKPAPPAPASEPPLDLAALNLGGGPPEGAHAPVDLGLSLNFGEPSAPAAATPAPAKAKPAPSPKPAKPAPPPPPEEAPFPADFAASLSGEKPAENPLSFGLGLDLGAAPASPPSKPAPKAPAPAAPAPAAAPATPAPARKSGAKPIWKDKRVLIGAGAGSALCVALGLAIVLGAFGGGEKPKSTTKKGKVKPASSSVAVNSSREKPVKTTKPAAPRPTKSAAFEATVPEGEGFAVQAGDKTYSYEPDLKNAMQCAIGSHGRVVLNDKSPRKLTGSDAMINISGGMLTIAAAPETQPVLEVEVKGGTPWLSTRTDTPLTLIGVTIVVHYSAPGPDPAPIILAGGKVTLDRCAFRVVGAVPGSRAVTAEGGGLSASGCWFEGFDKALDVSAFAGTTITVKQCMMVRAKPDAQPIGWGLRVRNLPGGAGKTARKLVMEHCTVKGKGLIDLVEFSSESPFDANVKDCALLGDAILAWESKAGTPLAPETLHWTGLGNVYDLHGKGWIVKQSDGTADLDGAPTDLDSWTKRFTDRDAAAKPLAFATDASALSDEPQPSDFAIADTQAGADPNKVGPKAKP